MKLLVIAGFLLLQAPSTVAFVVVGNYSAGALGVIAFVFGAMFGYMAALQIERPAPTPAPHVDSQPPATRRELVIYEVTGKEVL